jgi:hypothetical protein
VVSLDYGTTRRAEEQVTETILPDGSAGGEARTGLSRNALIAIRVSAWLFFGVIFGLLPLIIKLIGMALGDHGLSEFLDRGELFIIGGVIAAGAIGELFASYFKGYPGARAIFFNLTLGFLAVIACVANTIAYMQVAKLPVEQLSLQSAAISTLTFWFLLGSIFTSGISVGMAAAR